MLFLFCKENRCKNRPLFIGLLPLEVLEEVLQDETGWGYLVSTLTTVYCTSLKTIHRRLSHNTVVSSHFVEFSFFLILQNETSGHLLLIAHLNDTFLFKHNLYEIRSHGPCVPQCF